jgi:hypothetical protein
MIKDPEIIDNVFPDDYLNELTIFFQNNYKTFEHSQGFNRYVLAHQDIPNFKKYMDHVLPIARKIFNSNTLLHTYSIFAHYEDNASLHKHKDDNACTYTLDTCIYQNEPWDIYVEDASYTLFPNQSLAFYGNDQAHWRESFPNPKSQHVAMIFFHFAEPDHWYFTKGPSYHSVIRKELTEEQWQKKYQDYAIINEEEL